MRCVSESSPSFSANARLKGRGDLHQLTTLAFSPSIPTPGRRTFLAPGACSSTEAPTPKNLVPRDQRLISHPTFFLFVCYVPSSTPCFPNSVLSYLHTSAESSMNVSSSPSQPPFIPSYTYLDASPKNKKPWVGWHRLWRQCSLSCTYLLCTVGRFLDIPC